MMDFPVSQRTRVTRHAPRARRARYLACLMILASLVVSLEVASAQSTTARTMTLTTGSSASDWFERGSDAWDTGDYLVAIEAFERSLASNGGESHLRDIALLTGEWYQTVEVAPDGTAPQWSPNGRDFSFQVTVDGVTRTRVMSLDRGIVRHVSDIDGSNLSFAADGESVAYLRVNAGPDLEAARAAATAGIEVRSRADFAKRREALARVDAAHTDVVVRGIASGAERVVDTGDMLVYWVSHHPTTDEIVFVARDDSPSGPYQLRAISPTGSQTLLVEADRFASPPQFLQTRRHVVFDDGSAINIVDVQSGEVKSHEGSSPSVSRDGSTVAFLRRLEGSSQVLTVRVGSDPVIAFSSEHPIENVAVSPGGDKVVFQLMERENWELIVAATQNTSARQLTYEIQHDLFPRFLDDETVFAVIGEGRHRRSYTYDVATGKRTRLFHNNTIRTVAPEYEWSVSPDGSVVLIVSERDGDTISPERGLYLLDLRDTVSADNVALRLREMKVTETALRDVGDRLFGPIQSEVADIVGGVSTGRIYSYENDLFSFGSKYITQPGNARAIEYIEGKLRAFGYEPELQWFDPRPGVTSANIIATLPGAVDPQLQYVVSSHFDSVERGPGADDNTSGTSALLEAARVMRAHPQSATIRFAFFTGEEAGLLGSREFVRRAVASDDKIVGALNNDMVGFANDNRLDNTIRYSNDGIRDIQHNAARLFSDMITYDARYYKSTDAHAYYEAYGDIVGGIGSYPILGNPHYHQTHDVLETINHQLVAEVSKTTVATLALLASSPSRLQGLRASRAGTRATVTWDAAVESGIDRYVVRYSTPDGGTGTIETTASDAALTDIPAGSTIEVRAVNRRGMVGWDAARVIVD